MSCGEVAICQRVQTLTVNLQSSFHVQCGSMDFNINDPEKFQIKKNSYQI